MTNRPDYCPRCTGPMGLPGGSRMLTKRSDVDICGECCTDEAVRDAAGLPPIPPQEWPVKQLLTWSGLSAHT
jgi:hypothetical protein